MTSRHQFFQTQDISQVQGPFTSTFCLSVANLAASLKAFLKSTLGRTYEVLPEGLQECDSVEHIWYHFQIEGMGNDIPDEIDETRDCGTRWTPL